MSDLSAQLSELSAKQREILSSFLEKQGAEFNVFPLSFAQERLWFLEQLEPGSGVYHVPIALRLEGALNADILEQSLNEVIRRHEVLRTAFPALQKNAVQVVLEMEEFHLQKEDLRSLEPEKRENEARRLMRQEVETPFDLNSGRLIRGLLLRMADEDYLLLLTLHHIVTDGWSTGILLQEMAVLYEVCLKNKRSPLPDLPIQYADYAMWQREWLTGAVLDEQLQYWRQKLEGIPPLELRPDWPVSQEMGHHGSIVQILLPRKLASDLKALGRRVDATPFMTYLAAFQLLLSKYARQYDIAVGAAIANRNRAETEGLIGFFVNALVMRTDLSGDPSFIELLQRVREVTLGAYAHQDLPFEKLVEDMDPDRDLRHTPFFQVMFAFQNTPKPAAQSAGLKLSAVEWDIEKTKFNLELQMLETPEGMTAALQYRSDLFAKSTATRMLGQLKNLLEAIATAGGAERRISELSLFNEKDRRQIVEEWNATEAEYPAEKCIHELIREQAARTPAATALVCGEQRISYAELMGTSRRVAAVLQSRGVGQGTPVAICLEHSAELVIAILGILEAGGCYVPLDPLHPLKRMELVVSDCQAQAIVVAEANSSALESLPVERWSMEALLAAAQTEEEAGVEKEEAGKASRVKLDSRNAAYLIYTSGSTGKPKGVCIEHRSLVNYIWWACRSYGEQAWPLDLALYSSVAFDLTVTSIFAPLVSGGTVYVYPASRFGNGVVEVAKQSGSNTLKLTPSHLLTLEAISSGSLAQMILGGEALSTRQAREAVEKAGGGLTIWNEYGPTETTVGCTLYRYRAEDKTDEVPIGRPVANTQVYIVDEHMEPVPVGVAGELYVGGAQVGRGYVGKPEQTTEKFVANPFGKAGERLYRTGDLCRYREDGNMEYLGRMDDQVKVRGYRIELGEIEAALVQHAGVKHAAVMAREDRRGEKRLVGYLVRNAEETASTSELRNYLQEKLPEYMVPATYVWLEELPLTSNGKVNRRGLPEPEERSEEMEQKYLGPRTGLEELLCGVLAEVLGLKRVGIHDNFFELGGHSLLAIQVIVRVRDVCQIELRLELLFERPTVAALVEALEPQEKGALLPQISREPRAGEVPLSFAQQRLWFLEQMQRGTAAFHIPIQVRLSGVLDLNALRRSLNEVLRRHEVLRTVFPAVDGLPRQSICEPENFDLRIVDLRETAREVRESTMREMAMAEARRTFDLENGPLVRGLLLRTGLDDSLLVLTMHHIVTDGWSTSILLGELAALYDAYSQARPSPLQEMKLQYADYSIWQRRWLEGDVLEAQLQYWRNQLAGVSRLELPTDHPRTSWNQESSASLSFMLSEQSCARLESLCRQEGVTMFMVCAAAFSALLSRYAGQDDIALGIPVANRNRAEIEGLIGFFINTVVLRVKVPERATFQELLEQIRHNALAAYRNQDIPFEKLVDKLQPERGSDRNPFFQAMLVFQNFPQQSFEAPGLKLTIQEYNDVAVRSDVDFYVATDGQEIKGVVVYNSSLFEDATMQRFVGRLQSLIENAGEHPEEQVDRLVYGQDPQLPVITRESVETALVPLSYQQERLWFIDKFETGTVYDSSPVYHNIPLVMRLQGSISPEVLEHAIAEVVARHDSLRRIIVDHVGRGFQAQHALSVPLKVVNRTSDSPALSDEDVWKYAMEQASLSFSLGEGPLLRAALYLHGEQALLVLTFHHIIADAISTKLIAEELMEIYAASVTGRQPVLQEQALQYSTVANWQRSLTHAAWEPYWFYWNVQLAGDKDNLELPTKCSRHPIHIFKAGVHRSLLPPALNKAVHKLSAEAKTTDFDVLLAAFYSLLCLYSGQHNFCIGLLSDGRNIPGTEKTIGPLANLLAFRSKAFYPDFSRLLAAVAETMQLVRRHQEMPFELLTQKLALSKDMSRTVLFDVLFQYEAEFPKTFSAGDTSAEVVETNLGLGKYDVNLRVQDTPDGLACTFVYNQELFDHSLIEQMARHFHNLLEAVLADGSRSILEIGLLGRDEQELQLDAWNATAAEYPINATIHEIFERQAQKTPEHIAVSFEGKQISYRELDRRANQLANYLLANGAQRDHLIALSLSPSLEMIVAIFGVLKAGCGYLPIDPAYPEDRVNFILEDSLVSQLITTEARAELFRGRLPLVLALDAESEKIESQSSANPGQHVSPDHIAYCIYTSGSTGKPNGVLVNHRNVVRLMKNSKLYFEFNDKDVWTLFHSYCFDFSVWEIFGALLYGGRLAIVPSHVRRDPDAFATLLNSEKVTVLNQTPAAFYNLAAAVLDRPAMELALRYVVFGGEALQPKHLEKWVAAYPQVEMINMYGITETTVHVTIRKVTPEDVAHDISNVGRPIPTTTIYVLGPGMELLPTGVKGELFVGGDGVTRGYLNRPELTATRFVANPLAGAAGSRLYRSGDLGRYLPDGTIEYLGRIDHQVKLRGFRIELGEIESALLEQPEIERAIVLLRETKSQEKQLVAYLVPQGRQKSVGLRELREVLHKRLPEYMVPGAFVLLESLPLTVNGKIDRKALPLPEGLSLEPNREFIAPRNALEETLCGIWKEVLNVKQVSVDDNFFELGGDSILSIQIVARANRAGLQINPRQMFEEQTIARLAAVTGRVEAVQAEQGIVSGATPLTAIQHWFFAQDLADKHHFNQAVMLEADEWLDESLLERAVAGLLRHHDALRTRFHRNDGGWRQEIVAEEQAGRVLTRVDLSRWKEDERAREQERIASELQASLDLEHGPLMRVALLDLGKDVSQRLLIVIHHLVVDAVSWRILLEDLERVCRQLSRGEEIHLGPKTTSFQHWAKCMEAYAQSEPVQGEIGYWLESVAGENRSMPRDAEGQNTVESSRTLNISLDEEMTRALLQEFQRVYRMQIQDVLLTALAQAFCEWAGVESMQIDLEGHGREELPQGVDVTRTVGWFTTIFPVRLEPGKNSSTDGTLKAVKEQLRRIPQRGLGYGLLRYLSGGLEIAQEPGSSNSEVIFNYLGQLDHAAEGDGMFRLAAEPVGPTQSPRNQRSYILELSCGVHHGQLSMAWTYSANLHRESSIAALAGSFTAHLRSLISHCRACGSRAYTPSDFPLVAMQQEALDGLAGEIGTIGDIYPLTPTQEGILFHTLYAPQSGIYVEQVSCGLTGKVNTEALERAWQETVGEYEALRSCFVWEGLERPVQVVREQVKLKLEQQDWRDSAGDELAARLRAFLADDRKQGFDLRTPPVMRLSLFRVEEAKYWLVWSFHHLLLDGWSMPIVMNRIFRRYHAGCHGQELKVEGQNSYREYIRWLSKQDTKKAEEFWTARLKNFRTPTNLGISNRVEPGAQPVPAMESIALPEKLTQSLQEWCRQRQLTLNTVLQGMWALLLSRYTGQPDVVFGATMSGRSADIPEIESMVGMFVNTLPVRAEVSEHSGLSAFLRQIQNHQVDARQFEYTSLASIQKWSGIDKGSAMFESIVVVENYPIDASLVEKIEDSGVEITEICWQEQTNYPLTLVAGPGKTLVLRIDYDRNQYRAESIARILKHLANLLEQTTEAATEKTLAEFSLLTERERRQMVEEWNGTEEEYEGRECLQELFEDQVKRTPEAVAVEYEGRQWSYAELNRRANQLAGYLRKQGVGAETLVGVCLERSLEMVVGLMGIVKAGGAYVPLDPEYPVERLEYMVEDGGIEIVLGQKKVEARLPGNVKRVVWMEEEEWEEIGEEGGENLKKATAGGNAAYVIYTSGSTGKPKGAILSHGGIRNRLLWMQEKYGLGAEDRVLQKTPYSFDVSVWEFFWPLLVGARVVMARPGGHRDSGYLVETIQKAGITTMHFVPSMLEAFLNGEGVRECVGLKRVFCSGEALAAGLCRKFKEELEGAELHNLYGPTEATVDVSYWEYEAGWAEESIPIGRPVGNTQMYVMDESFQVAPVGVAGELYLGGVQLGRGYLKRADLTAERFVANPFSREEGGERLYRTGDLARYREDGAIEYLGRMDHQVKVRGNRIELGEIEVALREHAGVRQCVVMARGESGGEKRLVGYVVRQVGEKREAGETGEVEGTGEELVSASQLRSYLQERLPEYMVPGTYVWLEELPLSSNGKVDRKSLPEPAERSEEMERRYVEPRTEMEEVLCGIWAEVLRKERVGVEDGYYELGGDSILSLQVVARARKAGLELELRELLEEQTVGRLAKLLEDKEKRGERRDGTVEGLEGLEGEEEQSRPFSLIGEQDRERLPEDVEDAYPLSRLQAGMLFHAEYSHHTAIYHDIFGYTLEMRFDAGLLNQAIQAAMDRHPSLRTSFDLSGYNEPLQLVHRKAQIALQVEDLSHLPAAGQEQVLTAWTESEKKRAFDLATPGLLRVYVHTLAHDKFQFTLSFHHAILDGWSVASLLTEIFRDYFAFLAGRESSIAALRSSMREFVALERRTIESAEAQAYWNHQLAELEVTRMPWKSENVEPQPCFLQVLAPVGLAGKLEALARRAGVSIKSVLLAAHLRVVKLLSGQPDVLTGVIANGRPESDDGERILGLFLNTLPLRMRLDGGRWLDLVRDTAAAERALMPYRRYPFSELQRKAGSTALFEIAFNFVHFHVYRALESSGEVKILGSRSFEQTNFNLLVNFGLDISRSNIHLRLDYNGAAIDPRLAENIGRYYMSALRQMAESPEARYETAMLLTEGERRQIVEEWNGTEVEYEGRECLQELFEDQVKRTPEAVAVEYEGRQWSYAELNRRANQLARYLRKQGVGAETLVGVCLERSLEMVVGLMGIVKAGGAYVPLDPEYPVERLEYMVEDGGIEIVLGQKKVEARLPGNVKRVVWMEEEEWKEEIGEEGGENLKKVTEGGNAAYVIYTSGSTGKPKGAMVSHRGIRNRLLWMQEKYGLGAEDRVLQKTPYSFDVSVWEFFWPLLVGARVVMARPGGHRDSGYLVETIQKAGITTMHFVPSMLEAFLSGEGVKECVGLKRVFCSGEALAAGLCRRFKEELGEAALHNLYGPTEATVDVSYWEYVAGWAEESIPIGRPVGNTQMYVVDESFQVVPVGVAGELYLGGVQLGRGYLKRADLTAERFVANPFSREEGGERLYGTGDLARYREDGAIEYLGRLDHQVKVRGNRIELGEIEVALREHAGVKQCVVMAREGRGGGEKRLVGYVVRQAEEKKEAGETGEVEGAGEELVSASQLRSYLQQRLPEYMVPGTYVWLEELPLSSNGKVDRKSLPEPAERSEEMERRYVKPRTEVEVVLCGIWAEVLRKERVGVEDGYYELGGDSILSLQVVARARKAGLELELRELLEEQTVGRLAKLLEEKEKRRERRGGTVEGLEGLEGLEGEEEQSHPYSLIGEQDRERLPEDVEDAYPLSRLQAGMLFHAEYSPQTAIYHDIFGFHLKMPLRVNTMRLAIERVVAQHPVLRTAFDLGGYSEPLQLVYRRADVPLFVEDLSHLTQAAREEALQNWLAEEKRRSFDVSMPGLLRFYIHKISPETFQFTLSFHHAILDGWSIASLLTEVVSAYLGLSEGRQEKAQPLNATYREFIRLEQQAMESEESRNYWERQLDQINLARMPWATEEEGLRKTCNHDVNISQETSDGLRSLAREAGVSIKTVLLAAHARAVSLVSGQTDVVTGIVSNGRLEEEDGERVLGLFLNTLPFRMDVKNANWRELVQSVSETEKGLLAHRRYPLSEMQKATGNAPLFDTVFNFLHFHVYQQLQKAGSLELLGTTTFEQTNFSLVANFAVDVSSSRLRLQLEYDAEKIAQKQIERIGGYFRQILDHMATNSGQRCDATELLGAEEREQLLVEWNQTKQEHRGDSVQAMFEEQARLRPEAVAVVCGERELSYGELNRRANQVAHYLKKKGVGPEVVVGICMEPGVEMVVGILGAVKAGGAYLALDAEYPGERLAYMIADSKAKVVLVDSKSMQKLEQQRSEGTGRGELISLEKEWGEIGRESEENPEIEAEGENLAYVIYTSGSTGKPKGVMLRQSGLVNLVEWHVGKYGVSEQDRATQVAGTGFDASVWEVWPYLTRGASLWVAEGEKRRDAGWLVEWLEEEEISLCFLPTPMAEVVLEQMEEKKRKGGVAKNGAEKNGVKRNGASSGGERRLKLKKLLTGGDKLHRGAKEELGFELVNHYGPTENTVVATCGEVGVGEKRPGIGKPIGNTEVYVLDGEMELAPVGVVGELYVGGAGLARGYLGQAELTAEKFVAHRHSSRGGERLYRTGDLCRWRESGELEFIGRADQQVKVRGYRIELGEIESVLGQHGSVGQAAVVAREEERGGKRLVGYVVRSNGQPIDGEQLRQYMRERLPEYMVPAVMVEMEELPLTVNGKVDRKKLAELEVKGSGGAGEEESYVRPRTGVEEELCGIWAEVLGLERVGIHDNFFELGGDSILSIQIVARANRAGLRVTAREMFERQTVAELAEVVGQSVGVEAEQGEVKGAVPLTPIQHWFFEQELAEAHHFNQAVLLEAREEVTAEELEQVVEGLMRQHDALRMRYRRSESGEWEQNNGGYEETGGEVVEVDLSGVEEEKQKEELERAAGEWQGSLDLEQGPLVRVVLFEMGRGQRQRVLIVAHHLVVDGVSWRIVLEDLERGYGQVKRGEEVELGSKTTSFRQWAEAVEKYAKSEEMKKEAEYWAEVVEGEEEGWGEDASEREEEQRERERRQRENVAGTAEVVRVALTEEQTRALLQEAPQVYRMQLAEVLLTGVAGGYGEWKGTERVVIDLEGHGREEMGSGGEGLDVTRTVGWFTAIYPVVLGVEWRRGEAGRALREVKEQMRKIPQRGVGYGLLRYVRGEAEVARRLRGRREAELSFNYLGQMDQVLEEQGVFGGARESAGRMHSAEGRRSHELEINAAVAGGRLQMACTYSGKLHERRRVEELMGKMVEKLEELIVHCRSAEAGGYTPSDFPLVNLDNRELEGLMTELRAGQDAEA